MLWFNNRGFRIQCVIAIYWLNLIGNWVFVITDYRMVTLPRTTAPNHRLTSISTNWRSKHPGRHHWRRWCQGWKTADNNLTTIRWHQHNQEQQGQKWQTLISQTVGNKGDSHAVNRNSMRLLVEESKMNKLPVKNILYSATKRSIIYWNANQLKVGGTCFYDILF